MWPDMPKFLRRWFQFIFLLVFFGAALMARLWEPGSPVGNLPLLVAGFAMGCAILLHEREHAALIGGLLIAFSVLIWVIEMWLI